VSEPLSLNDRFRAKAVIQNVYFIRLGLVGAPSVATLSSIAPPLGLILVKFAFRVVRTIAAGGKRSAKGTAMKFNEKGAAIAA
jgi:hypothetical protein